MNQLERAYIPVNGPVEVDIPFSADEAKATVAATTHDSFLELITPGIHARGHVIDSTVRGWALDLQTKARISDDELGYTLMGASDPDTQVQREIVGLHRYGDALTLLREQVTSQKHEVESREEKDMSIDVSVAGLQAVFKQFGNRKTASIPELERAYYHLAARLQSEETIALTPSMSSAIERSYERFAQLLAEWNKSQLIEQFNAGRGTENLTQRGIKARREIVGDFFGIYATDSQRATLANKLNIARSAFRSRVNGPSFGLTDSSF